MKKPVSKKCIFTLGILCLVLLGSCWLCKSLFIGAPFSLSYILEGPSGVFPGNKGRMYLIDKGKKLVLLINEQGSISGTIVCGKDSDDEPFYASLEAL